MKRLLFLFLIPFLQCGAPSGAGPSERELLPAAETDEFSSIGVQVYQVAKLLAEGPVFWGASRDLCRVFAFEASGKGIASFGQRDPGPEGFGYIQELYDGEGLLGLFDYDKMSIAVYAKNGTRLAVHKAPTAALGDGLLVGTGRLIANVRHSAHPIISYDLASGKETHVFPTHDASANPMRDLRDARFCLLPYKGGLLAVNQGRPEANWYSLDGQLMAHQVLAGEQLNRQYELNSAVPRDHSRVHVGLIASAALWGEALYVLHYSQADVNAPRACHTLSVYDLSKADWPLAKVYQLKNKAGEPLFFDRIAISDEGKLAAYSSAEERIVLYDL